MAEATRNDFTQHGRRSKSTVDLNQERIDLLDAKLCRKDEIIAELVAKSCVVGLPSELDRFADVGAGRGTRPGRVCHCRWSDVDLQGRGRGHTWRHTAHH